MQSYHRTERAELRTIYSKLRREIMSFPRIFQLKASLGSYKPIPQKIRFLDSKTLLHLTLPIRGASDSEEVAAKMVILRTKCNLDSNYSYTLHRVIQTYRSV